MTLGVVVFLLAWAFKALMGRAYTDLAGLLAGPKQLWELWPQRAICRMDIAFHIVDVLWPLSKCSCRTHVYGILDAPEGRPYQEL